MPILELQPQVHGAEWGDHLLSQEGSGTAFPPGLETVFEYNGMVFNKLDQVDKIRVTKIDGLFDADIRDNRENNPSSDGETALDAFYSGRTIVYTGRIEAYRLEKLRDMQQAFRQAFADVGKEYPLIFHAYGFIPDGQGGFKRGPSIERTGQIYCRKSQPITMSEEQTDYRFYREFMLTLRASDPRFTAYLSHFFQWQSPAAGAVTNLTVFQALNNGNYPAAPLITLIGPMTNPAVTNLHSGEVLSFTGSIPVNRKWFIDVGAKTLLDLDGNSMFYRMDVASQFFSMYRGMNEIMLSATGMTTASSVTLEYRDSWM